MSARPRRCDKEPYCKESNARKDETHAEGQQGHLEGSDHPTAGGPRGASLSPGDRVVYDIEGDAVVIRKLMPLDATYLSALQTTLAEWNSPEDAEAYDDL